MMEVDDGKKSSLKPTRKKPNIVLKKIIGTNSRERITWYCMANSGVDPTHAYTSALMYTCSHKHITPCTYSSNNTHSLMYIFMCLQDAFFMRPFKSCG